MTRVATKTGHYLVRHVTRDHLISCDTMARGDPWRRRRSRYILSWVTKWGVTELFTQCKSCRCKAMPRQPHSLSSLQVSHILIHIALLSSYRTVIFLISKCIDMKGAFRTYIKHEEKRWSRRSIQNKSESPPNVARSELRFLCYGLLQENGNYTWRDSWMTRLMEVKENFLTKLNLPKAIPNITQITNSFVYIIFFIKY